MDAQPRSHPERIPILSSLILRKICGFVCTGLYKSHSQIQVHVLVPLLPTV